MITCFEDNFGYFNPCGCQFEYFDPTNLLSKSAICHHGCFEMCDCCALFSDLICPIKSVCFWNMCDIPNDIAMDGNTGETPPMDTLEAEKVDALQSEPSVEEAVQGSTVAGASQASQSPSQFGNKGRVARKMGSIKNSTSVLAIQNYVEVRRAKVPRKELTIDRCMEYGQSRVIDWDQVAEVKEDLVANPPDGQQQLLVSDDKGMGLLRHNSINVIAYVACRVRCAMMLYSVGALWVIGGQRAVAACDEICKGVTTRMGEVEDWMTNFDVRIIKFDTFLEIKRQLAGQHNRSQHTGRESNVPQLLNNFLQLATEDTHCTKTVVTLMCEAILEAGLTAKFATTETIVKQMRPAAHMALACGTAFAGALGKMVERKQVIALYTMQCFA